MRLPKRLEHSIDGFYLPVYFRLNNGISLLLPPPCNNFDLNFTGKEQPLEYLKNGDWIRLEHVAYVHLKNTSCIWSFLLLVHTELKKVVSK